MIRPYQEGDLDRIMELWLQGNRQAHAFVQEAHWEGHAGAVRGILPEAEVYVSEEGEEIRGFIGLEGDYIAGIFVADCWRSHGIGRLLLGYVKEKKERLTLRVYEKNTRAAAFYEREGFTVKESSVDTETGERESLMVYCRQL